MKQIEVYVHTANRVNPLLLKISEDATVNELIEEIIKRGGGEGHPDHLHLCVEHQDEPVEKHRRLSECEIRHRHHVHCHRCHKVTVYVFYNEEKHESFPPSAPVKRVLKWAIKEFKLSPAEAADKILVLKGDAETEVPLDAHIGSFTKPGHCEVRLCLTAPVEVQG